MIDVIKALRAVIPDLAFAQDAAQLALADLEVVDELKLPRAIWNDGLVPHQGGAADERGSGHDGQAGLPETHPAGAKRDDFVVA
jgi:hypothetical protein